MTREDGGVVIEVIDQGEGIAPTIRRRSSTSSCSSERRSSPRGPGLGLPISRRLAELLHGGLDVESELGKGSTFRLRLPDSAEGPALRATKHAEVGDVEHAVR